MPTLRLTPRDLTTLTLLGDHRFLDARQIGLRAFPSEDAARRRLHELCDARLVHRIFMPVRPYDDRSVHIYALAARGARYLPREAGRAGPTVTAATERRSGLFLDHTLRRNDVRLALETLAELHPMFTLLNWRQRREEVQFRTRDRKGARQLVVPDGVAIVRIGSDVEVIAIEVDLATVPVRRMERRYRAYWRDFTDGGPRNRLGQCSYRVLTITTDKARLEALRKASQRAPTRGRRGSRLFWFSLLSSFDPANPEHVLGEHFIHAGYRPDEVAPAPEKIWPALFTPSYGISQDLPPNWQSSTAPDPESVP